MPWYPNHFHKSKEVQHVNRDMNLKNCLYCGHEFEKDETRFDSAAFVNSICCKCHGILRKGKVLEREI